MNGKVMTEEYYNKFPDTLKNALKSGRVRFPASLQCQYEKMSVYRGVKYTSEKKYIDKTDFLSYIERKKENPMIPVDDSKISSYGCSCFMNMDEMRHVAKFPRKNWAIAKGIISSNMGPINVNEKTSHVDLFLYIDMDPSGEFEVVETWEKNGLG